MRLRTVIQNHADGRKTFLVYDDIHGKNSGIIGKGWTLADAVSDFVDEYNRWAFFDDDIPGILSRDDIELSRPVINILTGTIVS